MMDTSQVIVPYDDQWPAAFDQIARPLRTALGNQALRIDHDHGAGVASTTDDGGAPTGKSVER
jgi:GrpB-like predicted nucleotidyltransferase (UPF0157 family)